MLKYTSRYVKRSGVISNTAFLSHLCVYRRVSEMYTGYTIFTVVAMDSYSRKHVYFGYKTHKENVKKNRKKEIVKEHQAELRPALFITEQQTCCCSSNYI